MPYVNIPDSGLTGTIAKLVGKLQGQVVSHALKISTEVSNQLNKDAVSYTHLTLPTKRIV